MVKTGSWKWDDVSEDFWTEPAEDAYYLRARWQRGERKKLLDLGCGTGRHALFFAEGGFSVDAIDLSPSGIAILDRTLGERALPIRTKVGDMVSLPYGSGVFDCVLAFHVVYHSDRSGVERAIAEIGRVLAENGEAYLTFNSLRSPSFNDPDNSPVAQNTVIKTKGIEAGILHHFVDEGEVRRLMSNFEIIRLKHVEEIWKDRRSWHYFVLARKRESPV
jgi:SAM-dependent methyltransferase